MFGNKKSSNEGIKIGIRLSEEIVRRDTDALNKMHEKLENITEDTRELKKSVEEVIKNQETFEIEKLFGIIRTLSPDDLEKEEKIILLQILVDISKRYESNNNQKEFLRNLILYFEINSEDSLRENDFKSTIDNIDSKKVEKIMYKIIKEYLYLENDNNNYGNKYDEYLKLFVYGVVDNKSIENEIELKVSIFGKEILYQQFLKYNNNFEGNVKNEESDVISYIAEEEKEKIQINREIAEEYFLDRMDENNNLHLETTSYIVYPRKNKLILLDKRNKNKIEMVIDEILDDNDLIKMFKEEQITYFNDILYYFIENELFYINLESNDRGSIHLFEEKFIILEDFFEPEEEEKEKSIIKNIKIYKNILIYAHDKLMSFNLETKEKKEISDIRITHYLFEENFYYNKISRYSISSPIINFFNNKKINELYLLKENYIYFIDKEDLLWIVKRVNINNGFTEKISEVLKKDKRKEDIFGSHCNLYDFGIYKDNIFIILEDNINYLKGFYFDIKNGKVNKFEKNPIFSEFAAKKESKAQNLEQYNQYLIYEDEEIIKYDFLKDKRMTLGKGNYSKRYKRIDNYLFNTEKRIIELD